MQQQAHNVPVLYAYIYRHILENCNSDKTITNGQIVCALRKVVRKATNAVYLEIFKELGDMGFITKVNRDKYLVLTNSYCKSHLKRLREYIFPINPKF